MMSIRHGYLAAVAGGLVLFACVGSDPDTITPGPDAGATSSSSSSSSSSGDANVPPPTCAGKTFSAPLPVTVPNSVANVRGLRVVGANAYFNATTERRLYLGSYAPPAAGAGPTVSGATLLLADAGAAPEHTPTVSHDEKLLVFSAGQVGTRGIWMAESAGTNGFVTANAKPVANLDVSGFDQSDPWLVGAPTRALYFSRGASDGKALTIVRVAVDPTPGNVVFGDAKTLGVPCPGSSSDNCGAPVVDEAETTMLFAAWVTDGGYHPHVYEVALHGGTADQHPIEHPELGENSSLWISNDGCEILLSKPTDDEPTLHYAVRTAL